MKDYMLDPPEQAEYPACPKCKSTEYDFIYKDIDNEICGCSECVKMIDACDYWEEEYENAKSAYEDKEYDEWRDRQIGDI